MSWLRNSGCLLTIACLVCISNGSRARKPVERLQRKRLPAGSQTYSNSGWRVAIEADPAKALGLVLAHSTSVAFAPPARLFSSVLSRNLLNRRAPAPLQVRKSYVKKARRIRNRPPNRPARNRRSQDLRDGMDQKEAPQEPSGPPEKDPFAPLVLTAVRAADDRKAQNQVVLHVAHLTAANNFHVIMTGGSKAQIRAILDNIQEQMYEEHGIMESPKGDAESGWATLDYDAVLIHVFRQAEREYYKLEDFWRKGQVMDLSEVVTPDKPEAPTSELDVDEDDDWSLDDWSLDDWELDDVGAGGGGGVEVVPRAEVIDVDDEYDYYDDMTDDWALDADKDLDWGALSKGPPEAIEVASFGAAANVGEGDYDDDWDLDDMEVTTIDMSNLGAGGGIELIDDDYYDDEDEGYDDDEWNLDDMEVTEIDLSNLGGDGGIELIDDEVIDVDEESLDEDDEYLDDDLDTADEDIEIDEDGPGFGRTVK